eukprot:CAMPEP_0202868000 /NCGR_PEP_ID=MMETSP1391-20130828/9972_1 /ASSEMBLY_ACC=CAM_ASM_000867 /TAXON_ID=1034604 /ORGANISM="Chlamydomonas leiostraca, Strain SAG 11-49" /LENGTH=202 /DNA_ID=CAMNT_0049548095 /DNA_START=18 /DNA_END=626 /DNA_ORIENTATION=+
MAVHRITVPFIGPKASDILLWRNVKKSGVCFVGSVGAFSLLLFSGRSPIVLVLYALAILIATALFWHLGAGFLHKAGPPVPAFLTEGLSDDDFNKLVAKLRGPINTAAGIAGKVLSGSDAKLSAQVFAALLGAAWVLDNVNLLVLGLVATILAFALPKAYEIKKDDADKVLDMAATKVQEAYKKLDEVVLKKIPSKATKKTQ